MTSNLQDKIIPRERIAAYCAQRRARGERIVFTNGCYDILHAGHVTLLHQTRALGDCLVVGLNSDGSVRRLKGATRPVHDEAARALVLAALADVDAVCIFEEDTPVEIIRQVRPAVHVKGGDYRPDDLPEATAVREGGGEVVIVPLRPGFSTTGALEKLSETGASEARVRERAKAILVIPARYGSTRFPGKPLARLGNRTVIEHVVRAGLLSRADRPVCVATDDERIARVIRANFQVPGEPMPGEPMPGAVEVVMTDPACATGTDRIAEAVHHRFKDELDGDRLIIVNVQGDEPFLNPRHIDALIEAMLADPALDMATLATPLQDAAQIHDPNVVKVVLDQNGQALYFSRLPIPFERMDIAGAKPSATRHLRHLGIYAYAAPWLLRMASLAPTPLEQVEKLEQLRALENGVGIKVVAVENVVQIAIDTPQDLARAEAFLAGHVGT